MSIVGPRLIPLVSAMRPGDQRRVPLAQRIGPGQTDRFEIPVSAAASSEHVFRVRLVYGPAEEVVSEPITLDLLIPRQPR